MNGIKAELAQVKRLGKKLLHTTTIDGDLFSETLPLFSMYQDIFHSSPVIMHSLFHKAMTMDYNEANDLILTGIDPENDGTCTKIIFTEQGIGQPQAPFNFWYYHPVLIPLTDQFQFDPFVRKYEDGKLINGGTFFLKNQDESWNPIEAGAYKMVRNFDTRNVSIGDTISGCEMQWICWHGCLFSRYPVILAEQTDADGIQRLLTSTIFSAYIMCLEEKRKQKE